jgi:hypothetical protein
MATSTVVILCVALIIVAATIIGYYLHRKHQRMLAAMSTEQRELYEAEKEYKKSVKRAERELWWANSQHSMKVTSAEAALSEAQEQGRKHLGSYSGVDGRRVELWQNRIRMPQMGKKISWWEAPTNTTPKAHYFEGGPVKATVDTTGSLAVTNHAEKTVGYDTRELYLMIEGPDFASVIQCRPDDGPEVRYLAAQINNASKSIHSVLQAREQAIAQAKRKLQAIRNDRTGIETARERLEAAKSNTQRLDAAREQVEKALPAPSEANTAE